MDDDVAIEEVVGVSGFEGEEVVVLVVCVVLKTCDDRVMGCGTVRGGCGGEDINVIHVT